MKNKKLKNPFKVWGSYLGVVLAFFFLPVPVFMAGNMTPRELLVTLSMTGADESVANFFMIFGLVYFIAPLVISFLLGWGLHVLIIKIIRKKGL